MTHLLHNMFSKCVASYCKRLLMPHHKIPFQHVTCWPATHSTSTGSSKWSVKQIFILAVALCCQLIAHHRTHFNTTHNQKQTHCAVTLVAIKSSNASSFCHPQQMLLYKISECKHSSNAVTYMDRGNASSISNLTLKAACDGVQIL